MTARHNIPQVSSVLNALEKLKNIILLSLKMEQKFGAYFLGFFKGMSLKYFDETLSIPKIMPK